MTDTREDAVRRVAEWRGGKWGPLTDEEVIDASGLLEQLAEAREQLAQANTPETTKGDGPDLITDPEASELDDIKATVATALGCKTWDQARELAELREARRR